MEEDLYQVHLHLYNTEAKNKEAVIAKDNKIKMYTCGPTVYDFAHIGNFRTYVFEDLLRRAIKYFGFTLFQVMNITDVDDKTIKGALEKNISLKEYTKPYIEAFFEDLKALNIEKVEAYPKATEYISKMIEMIQILLDKGIAYQGADGNIFFSIRKFPSYGRLSHLHLDDLIEGASDRISHDEYDKESASDFVLWKAYDPKRDGNVFWESPFGRGRPGWHIECSAMATSLLGETIDIHVGGVDNIFPHHENEIAQSEACTGKHFVKHWVHAEHLLVEGKKMSKSLGNFYKLRDLFAMGYQGPEVRYLLLGTHYRTQLNFTFESLNAAKSSLQRIKDFVARLQEIHTEASSNKIRALLDVAKKRFLLALSDDLNISAALAALFDLIREVNVLCDKGEVGIQQAGSVLSLLEDFDRVLGFLPLKKERQEIPEDILEAFQKRQEARAAKDFKTADYYRDFIHAKGFFIEDRPEGSRVKKK
ncbi:MAG: cysteine--tRNA ligase [Simkaniaceae bacterium]